MTSGRCATTEALEAALDCRGWGEGTVSKCGGWPAICTACEEIVRAALASPCCEGADQEQVKARCRSVEHHLDLVDIHDAEEECNWARVEAAKSEIAAALALLGSQNEKGGVTMRPRCGVFVCDQEATTTMRVLIPSQDERSLAPYDLPVCPEHEIATRPEPELSVVTEPS